MNNILIVAKVIAHVPSPAGEGWDEGENKMPKLMQRLIKQLSHSVLLICFILLSFNSWGMTLDQQRAGFLRAENLIRKGSSQQFKAALSGLEDYPLYPYLNYQWLKKHLAQDSNIKSFLKENADTRYAGLLRSKWLHNLASKQRWQTYLKNYQQSSNTSLQCQYHWAQYRTGKTTAALRGAKKLWLVGKSQPKACDALFKKLIQSRFLSKDMIWTRFQLALQKGKISLAKYVMRQLDKKQQKTASFWIKVHRQPALITNLKNWRNKSAQSGLIFAHGVDRMARKNSLQALDIWDTYKSQFKIDQTRREKLEIRLALALAYKKNQQAYNRLKNLRNPDQKAKEWRVRAALLEQDWHHVNASIAGLPTDEKTKDRWRYWQARAFFQTGKKVESNLIYKQLANRRSYFGFLAADILNLQPQLRDKPIYLQKKDREDLQGNKHFRVVNELRYFNRELETRRQWWFAIRHFTNKQKITAAKLAQQWGWNQIAIFTIAKAKHWDDVNLRFPFLFSEQIEKTARVQQLDPAIVFGLIRRESVFDKNAQSPVGAKGLMQIMPRTGRQIARDLKEKWRSSRNLFKPDVNIRYGIFYYKQMLDRFDGHFAMAAAAYNAGPHRVKQWLPEKQPLAADIWIETIPFNETREYVAAVLAYAMIYQQRKGWKTLNFKNFMHDIQPG